MTMTQRVARRWMVAVDATGFDPHKVYYHGTASEKAGRAIMQGGIEPPDLTLRGGTFRPVDGKVYLTPHLSYGVLYTLGGELAEAFMRRAKTYPERLWSSSPYGYLFKVPGRALTNIHPDEDSIGAILADGTAPSWLQGLAKQILSKMHPEIEPGKPNSFFTPDFFDRSEWQDFKKQSLYDLLIEPGMFELQAQAVAGKLLLAEMSPEQEVDLLMSGVHVAHEGRVVPTECWKFHKSQVGALERDGSNFFQLAERCH